MQRSRAKNDVVRTERMCGHLIPFYRVTVQGIPCEIPQHLYRVDTASSHGWSFSLVRKGMDKFKFFVADKDRSLTHSLDLAVEKMRKQLDVIPHQKNVRFRMNDSKKGDARTGVSGVSMTWQFRGDSGYQLLITSSAGTSTANKSVVNYVGTEFTVNNKKLQAAFTDALTHRKFAVTRHVIQEDRRFPTKNSGNRKFGVSLEQVRRLLIATKEKDSGRIATYIESKVPISLMSAPRLKKWRQMLLSWDLDRDTGLYIPSFISKDGRNKEWTFNFTLPCGSNYGGSIKWGRDMEVSLRQAIGECFYDSLMSTYDFIPEERVHNEKIDYLKAINADMVMTA